MTRAENPYRPPQTAADRTGGATFVRADAATDVPYGWVHVVLAAAAMIGTLPGRTHGLGMITEPLLSDTQIDRTVYANINLVATLLGALFCWPAGIMLDRWGTRRVLTGITIALGAVVVSMSHINLASPLAMLVAITLTRALGQSMLSVASLALIGKSFRGRLGLAMGTYSLLVGLGFGAAFKLTGSCIKEYGWRNAWEGIGWVLIAGLAPLAWVLVRDALLSKTPDLGAFDDEASDTVASDESSIAGDATLVGALASPVFWIFAITSSFYGMISSGLALFNQSILAERGFSTDTYYTVLSIGSLAGMASNLFGGWAATYCSLNRLLSAAMALLAASLAALPLIQTVWQVYGYAAVLGAAGGVVTVCFFTVWGMAFGRRHLGQIQGAAQMMTVLASAAGPRVFAEAFAQTGSYTGAFYVLAPISLSLAAAAWFIGVPSVAPTLRGGDPVASTLGDPDTSHLQQESPDHVYRD